MALDEILTSYRFPERPYVCLHCDQDYTPQQFDDDTYRGIKCTSCKRTEEKPFIQIKADILARYSLYWEARRFDRFNRSLELPCSDRFLTCDERELEKRLTKSLARKKYENGKNHQGVAFDLKLQREFKTLGDKTYTYHPIKGYYVPAEHAIAVFTQASLGDFCNRFSIAEVQNAIQVDTRIKDASLPLNKVPLKNGVYDFTTNTLAPHSPDNFYITTLPFEYNPTADCPNFKKYLNTTLGVDNEGLTKQQTIRQIFAYTFVPGQPLQRAFLLYGEHGCGKSQVINILTEFIGPDNVSAVSLQKLESNMFASARLYGKYLNTCADIPKNSIDEAPVFKAITGGDKMDLERKFQEGFAYRATTKLLFSANEFPRTNENPGAWASRWVFIAFNKRFRGAQNEVKDIWKTCTTPEELSGIFNLVIPELAPLLAEGGKFASDMPIDEKVDFYEEQSEPETVFLEKYTRLLNQEELGQDKKGVTNDELYGAFAEFLKEKGRSVPEHNVLGRMFKRSVAKIYGGQVKNYPDKKLGRTWFGLTLNEDWKLRDLMPSKPKPQTPSTPSPDMGKDLTQYP